MEKLIIATLLRLALNSVIPENKNINQKKLRDFV